MLTLGAYRGHAPALIRTKNMSVSSVGSSPPIQAPTPQKVDRPNDGDGDSNDVGGAKSAAPVQAAPAPGTGAVVNKTA
jgi:hypothetical protein